MDARNIEAYQHYLESDEWKKIRNQRLAIDGFCCQGCGSRGTTRNPLQIHHFSYRQPLGKENVFRDLVTLCRACHSQIHAVMNRITSENGERGWKDSLPISMVHVTQDDLVFRD